MIVEKSTASLRTNPAKRCFLFVFLYGSEKLVYQGRMEIFLPRQTPLVQSIHERVWVKFFYVINARLLPLACHHHHCPNHCRNTGGVRNCLRANFLVAFLMVADVINIVRNFLAILHALTNTADVCLTNCPRAERCWVWQNGFQELQRYNFLALHTESVQ